MSDYEKIYNLFKGNLFKGVPIIHWENIKQLHVESLNTDIFGFVLSDALCGQLQCKSRKKRPVVDYGWSHTKVKLSKK